MVLAGQLRVDTLCAATDPKYQTQRRKLLRLARKWTTAHRARPKTPASGADRIPLVATRSNPAYVVLEASLASEAPTPSSARPRVRPAPRGNGGLVFGPNGLNGSA